MTCDLVMDRLSGDGGGKLRALVLNKMSKYEGQGETHTAHTSVVSIHNSCSSNDRGCMLERIQSQQQSCVVRMQRLCLGICGNCV